MAVYVINYADGEVFERNQKYCSWSAKYIGRADKVIEFSSKDIPDSYRKKNASIFQYKRGGGLWLWKPYIITKTLHNINDGDWVLYVDSGSLFISDINKLINCAISNNSEIMLFEQPTLNRQFCKREVFELLGIVDHGENQTLGFLLLKNSDQTRKLMHEWLSLCEREELISPNKFYPEIQEFSDFYSHREDQSILSLLRLKHNIPVFRDCSDYGYFTYEYYNPKWTYNPLKYKNSNYGTIFLCNRKSHPIKYLFYYIAKRCLNFIGFYTEEWKIKRVNNRFINN